MQNDAHSSTQHEKDVRLFNARAAAWDVMPHRRKMAGEIAAAMDQAGVFAQAKSGLDFGCGTGILTLELAHRLERVTGLDNSPGMLAKLDAKIAEFGLANVSTQLADLTQGDAVSGTFDLVASAMALHHVADLPAVLKGLFALTAPGGRLALADLDSEGGIFHDDPTGVYHFGFDRQELAATLEGCGWIDLSARTATTLAKTIANGTVRDFPIFLMTGRKRA